MTVVRVLLLMLLVVVAVPGALFTIQNLEWTAQLSIDLYSWAWKLQQPMPVPHLMWISFLVGTVCGTVLIPVAKAAMASGGFQDDFGSHTR